MRCSQKHTVRQLQAGRPGLALDPQNRRAAHYLARSHQWERKCGDEHIVPATLERTTPLETHGLLAFVRNLAFHGIFSRPAGSTAGRPSRVAREHPRRLSLVRPSDQAGSILELLVAQGGQVCWPVRDGSGAVLVGFGDVEADEMMAMALQCLRFVIGDHQLYRESALW